MSRYQAPLDVDLAPAQRTQIYIKRRVNAATGHAKRAANTYARVLLRVAENTNEDPIARAGGKPGIMRTMSTALVHKALREYAADIVIKLVNERGVR